MVLGLFLLCIWEIWAVLMFGRGRGLLLLKKREKGIRKCNIKDHEVVIPKHLYECKKLEMLVCSKFHISRF